MVKTKHPITAINGFNIGDKVRLKDGSWTMLDNIELFPSNLDEAADKFAFFYDQGTCDGIVQECFKAGAEWMAKQGVTVNGYITDEIAYNGVAVILDNEEKFKPEEEVIVQIRKK